MTSSSLLCTALGAVTICGALSAQDIIPSTVADGVTVGNSSSNFPWSRTTATAASNDIRIQFGYDSTELPANLQAGPVLVNRLRFRAQEAAATTTWDGGTYLNAEIRLGKMSVDYASMTTTFATNYLGGVEPAPIYTGPVTVTAGAGLGAGIAGDWYIDIPVANALVDLSGTDDFVIDIKHDGQWVPNVGTTGGSTNSDYSTGTQGALTQRMYNSTDANALTGSGPFTSGSIVFEVSVTPPAGTFANFAADVTEVGDGGTVNFTDTTFTSDPGGIVAWDWDLDGDGVFGDSTLQNPSWTYATCGAVDVSLTVIDASAVSDTITKTAFINVVAPTASFTFTPLTAVPPIAMQFNSTSTAAGGSPVYDWDLDGDGVFELLNGGPSPIGVFATQGLFPNIGMTVTSACGSDTTTRTVDTRQGLCTTFVGGNGLTATGDGAGNFFDLTVINPAGLTITGLSGNLDSAASPNVTCDVYITPTTYVGNELTPGVWTQVSTGVGIGAGAGNETNFAINGFCLAPGTYGVLVYYVASAGGIDYTTGANTYANADMSITAGAGIGSVFAGGINTPRTWNGCLFYEVGATGGSYTFAGSGGCPASTGSIVGNSVTGGGVPTYGQPFGVTMTNAPANEPIAFVVMGFTDLGGVPLNSIGMTGCLLWADPTTLQLASTDATGTGSTVPFGIPNNPTLFGASIWTQPFVRDLGINPFSAVLGEAFKATIGCP